MSSAVEAPRDPVPHTVTPRAVAASTSIAAFAIPVVTSSRSSGSRSSTRAGNGVRSRIATTASKPRSRSTSASSSATWSRNTSTSASPTGPSSRAATP